MTATRRTFPFGTPASVIAEQTVKDREELEQLQETVAKIERGELDAGDKARDPNEEKNR